MSKSEKGMKVLKPERQIALRRMKDDLSNWRDLPPVYLMGLY